MKKFLNRWAFYVDVLRKPLRIMRWSLFLLVMSIFQAQAISGFGQKTEISLNFKNATVASVLSKIEDNSHYYFMCNRALVNLERTIDIQAENQPVEKVLAEIFKGTDVKYVITGRQIVLTSGDSDSNVQEGSQAQQPRAISGRVTDSAGLPLPGVTVVIKGKTTGTITDAQGNFSLANVPADATLAISFVGMKPLVIKVAGRTSFNVTMVEETVGIDEVVAIGYGTVKRSDLTGSVSSIKAKELAPMLYNNSETAIQGKVAGVTISNPNEGRVGTTPDIRIRGINSINSQGPLIITDGIQGDKMNMCSPSDIESIEILKDASAAAIYGSRAANGVIIITTKKGNKGPVRVNFNATFSASQLAKKLDMCNSDQWVSVMKEMYKGTGLTLPAIATTPQVTGTGTDWQNEFFSGSGARQYYNVSISGGTDNFSHYSSVNYQDTKGIMMNSENKQFVIYNNDTYTNGPVKLGAAVSMERNNLINIDGSNLNAALMVPAYQMYNTAKLGGFQGADDMPTGINNPVALSTFNQTPKNEYSRTNLNFFGELTLMEGLKFKSSYNWADGSQDAINTRAKYELGYDTGNNLNWAKRGGYVSNNWQWENTLSYNKVIAEKHSVNALIGYESTYHKGTDRSMEGRGMPDGIWELGNATQDKYINTYTRESKRESYFGRIIYSYDKRYMLNATVRADGSSKFYKTNRWGYFPSVGAGWNVANEQFFKNLGTPLSLLKLSATWGQLGVENLDDYAYFRNMSSLGAYTYPIGTPSTVWAGTIESTIANTDIQWEKQTKKNLRLELELWNGKLSSTFEVYNNVTTNMLMNVTGGGTPPSVGANGGSLWINAGKVSTNGAEMVLTYNGKKGDFNYSVTGTWSHNKSNVDELNEGRVSIPQGIGPGNTEVTYTRVGHPVYGFYLVQTDGLFRSQAEIDAYTKGTTKIQPFAKVGDQRFKDANDDGKIDDLDRVFCGQPFPPHEFGLRFDGSWKAFDFSMYLQGVAGNKIYNTVRAYSESGKYITNFSTDLLDSYTFNTNSDIPRLEQYNANDNGMHYSDRWLENGSYVRLKTMTLGYTLPENLTKKVRLGKCRFYVAADNLLTITGYSGYTPNVRLTSGVDNVESPPVRSFHAGLQLNF